VTWAFKVDIAPLGAKRQWRSPSGFPFCEGGSHRLRVLLNPQDPE
jgi:hypothetical protein